MDSLLQLLKQNARFTNQQLAAMLDTTEADIAARIKDFEKKGVIMGYSVILNDELADKDTVTAFIEIRVTPQRDCGFDDLAKTIMMYDEVESVSLMSGAYDLAVTVTGADLKTIALFVAQKLSTIEGVISTATHFVLRRYKEKGIFIKQDKNIDERGLVSP
ncbi:MAG: Lrp/AsnC family transcriptional regulator [Oscillospiraceae bacterium]|nr:Lrp/AsnC family transcriptional regulator [Ruminococcus sp.]MBP1564273.1 Lrp/AsnC family transcriptional regulator [Oscillospiraceae bacterium]MBQ9981685.1 Lrp/AsnC family transcriptional regulator [Oscillospiraceae bacterium]MBR6600103.1 Lrp/AsnC family transcriptional regulator [Oscillospiraceae bacterium]